MANAAAMIRQIGKQMGLTDAQIRMMIATAKVESSLRPDAVGDGGHSFGLFQHNRFGAGGDNAERFKDPLVSIKERARWFKERNITTPEGAYNLQRPADRGDYIRKLTAALKGGGAELNAPITTSGGGSLGLGSELTDLGGGAPSVSPYASRIAGLQSVRDRLGVSEDEVKGFWDEGDDAKPKGVDLRGRTASLASQRAATAAAKPSFDTSSLGAGLDDHAGHDHGSEVTGAPKGGGYLDIYNFANSKFGLRIDSGDPHRSNQTTGGRHADGSYHYQGRAVDFGDAKNSPEKLRALAAWARKNAPRIKELYYDPLGWFIRDGKIHKGSIGGHGNHLHIAM